MSNNINGQDTDDFQGDAYSFIRSFSEKIYDNEVRRNDSIIQQAGQMQTSFSFITAAVFMIAPVVIEYRGSISLAFFLVAFSSIGFCILMSLFFATMAQNQKKRDDFPTVSDFIKLVVEKETDFATKAQREKYQADTLAVIHKNFADSNDRRIMNIQWSMRFFYTSLALCVFWFIVAMCKII